MKRYVGLGFLVVALILILVSLFTPWWSQSIEVKDSDTEMSEGYGMMRVYTSVVTTDDSFTYNCPECGDSIAYDKKDLEDEKNYYCPECGDYIASTYSSMVDRQSWVCPTCGDELGYSWDDQDSLKRYCPECGYTVGSSASDCNSCGASFSEPSGWCDQCDEGVNPVQRSYCDYCDKAIQPEHGYYCYECEEVSKTLDKEKSVAEGDSYDYSAPYSNYQLSNPDKEDGLENKFNVMNMTFYFLLFTIIFLIVAIIGYSSVVRRKGKLHGKVKVPIVLTVIVFVFALITPIYFAAALPTAIDDDYEDKSDELLKEYEEYYPDTEKPKQIVKGFSGSTHKNESSLDFSSSYGGQVDADYSWGPNIGWYLAMIGMIMVIIALISLIATRKRFVGYSAPAPDSGPEPFLPPRSTPTAPGPIQTPPPSPGPTRTAPSTSPGYAPTQPISTAYTPQTQDELYGPSGYGRHTQAPQYSPPQSPGVSGAYDPSPQYSNPNYNDPYRNDYRTPAPGQPAQYQQRRNVY
jgi:predicted RNA-binding Zn-ribbon protein involved in translation (DUF1610 family)